MKENGISKIVNKMNYDACDKYMQDYTAWIYRTCLISEWNITSVER